MQPKSHEEIIKYFKNRLLPILDGLIKAKENEVPLTHVGGIDIEIADLLLKAYYSSLPKELQAKLEKTGFNPKEDRLVDSQEVLIALQEYTRNTISLSQEEFEKQEVYDLKQILRIKQADDEAKTAQEKADKEQRDQAVKIKSQAEEYTEHLKEIIGDPLARELEITLEKAKEIIKEAVPEIRKKDNITPTNTLSVVLSLAKKDHGLPVALESAERVQAGIDATGMGARFLEIGEIILENKAQKKQSASLIIKDRALRTAETWCRFQAPELFEDLVFVDSFRRGLAEGRVVKIGDFQKFLQETIVKSVETARITVIAGEKISSEQVLEIAKKAVKDVPAMILAEPEISPLSKLDPPTLTQKNAQEAVESFLEETLTESVAVLGVGEEKFKEALTQVSTGLIKEMTSDQEVIGFFLPELEKEERIIKSTREQKATRTAEILIGLFEKEGIAFPAQAVQKLEKVIERNLIAESGSIIQPLTAFLSEEKETIVQLENNLKTATQAPALFFTTALPLPLKPIGLILDAVSAVSPKAKDALLTGFIAGDKKSLKAIVKDCIDLYRETKRDREFAESVGDTAEAEKLESEVNGLKNIIKATSRMEKEVKKPSLFSRPFIGLGNFLRKSSRVIDKKFPHPLSIFSRLKKINFSQFTQPFSSSLSTNLRTMAGGFLQRLSPNLFFKSSTGQSVFKFSFRGLKRGVGNFFGRIKNFFSDRIFKSPIIKSVNSFGTKLLTRLGLGGLTKIGFGGLIKKGLGFGLKALGLGIKGGLGLLSGGATLVLEGGKRLLSLAWKGLSSLFGGLFGQKDDGSEGGGGGSGGMAEMALQNTDIIVPLLLLAGVVLFYFFWSSPLILKGLAFIAPPFGLGK